MRSVIAFVFVSCASQQPQPSSAKTAPPATIEVAEPRESSDEESDPPAPARTGDRFAVAACRGEPTAVDLQEAKKRFSIGIELIAKGNDAGAAVEFSRAWELSCKPAVLHNLGVALERLGETDRAIAVYERFLELDPDGPRASEIHERIAKLRSRR